jgi:hypothetical protein
MKHNLIVLGVRATLALAGMALSIASYRIYQRRGGVPAYYVAKYLGLALVLVACLSIIFERYIFPPGFFSK